jgi:hypothetical protein
MNSKKSLKSRLNSYLRWKYLITPAVNLLPFVAGVAPPDDLPRSALLHARCHRRSHRVTEVKPAEASEAPLHISDDIGTFESAALLCVETKRVGPGRCSVRLCEEKGLRAHAR